jgi:hypothetical protein
MDSKELRQMSLDNAKLAMEQWNRLMEPKDWKDEILEMGMIGLEDAQREMLLKILSDDFYISNEMERIRLRVIVEEGYYYEWDRGYLNGLRGAYLKGVNWIK